MSKLLLDQYTLYMGEIGPMKLFRKKQEMWQFVARKINSTFNTKKNGEQVSKQFDKIIQKKKDDVKKNMVSGAVRNQIEFQDELEKIAARDDSIEPEVLRGVDFVKYKETTIKEKINQKKPRWDKPTKKNILDVLSKTMLSVEQRRVKREAEKERQREERHKLTIDLLNSLIKK